MMMVPHLEHHLCDYLRYRKTLYLSEHNLRLSGVSFTELQSVARLLYIVLLVVLSPTYVV